VRGAPERPALKMLVCQGHKHPVKIGRDIGDDISIKSSNVKLNISDVCNLINNIKRAI
jgi:hypothetical protein